MKMKKEEQKQHLIDIMKDDEEGPKWMQERMYSEEEVYDLLVEWTAYQQGFPRVDEDEIPNGFMSFNQWFEQFKKKTQ